jgi:polyisoprenoid-binding protein YceI
MVVATSNSGLREEIVMTTEALENIEIGSETPVVAKWGLDASHSHAGFSVRHLMISNVRGEFTELTSELQFDPENIQDASVHVAIKAASINTRDANRDGHLRSADFFDVELYPEILFQSSNWESKSNGELLVMGDLTIHGKTRPVLLTVESTPIMKDPWGGTRVGFSGKTKINRKDFGLTWNAALETGGFVVGDEITITLEAEFVKQ